MAKKTPLPKTKPKHSMRVRIYQYAILAIGLLIAFTPTMYAGLSQADLRVVVTAMGIDKDADGIVTLSAISIVPQEAEPMVIHHVITAEGSCIAQALQSLSIRTGRLPETGHCEILILGKTAAQLGVMQELNFLFASGIVSGGANVLISRTDAAEFLSEEAELNSDAIRLNNLTRYASRGAHVVTTTLHKLLSDMASQSAVGIVPVTAIEDGEHQGVECAVVLERGQIIHELSEDETTGIALLDPNTKSGTITVDNFEVDGQAIGTISGRLVGKSSRVLAARSDDRYSAHIRLRVTLELPERHILFGFWGNAQDSDRANTLLEEAFAAKITDYISQAAAVSKNHGVDIFGVNTNLYRKTRQVLPSSDVVAKTDYNIEVTVRIR